MLFFVLFDPLDVPVYFLLASLGDITDFGFMFSSTSLTRKYLCCATSALLVVSTVPTVSAASEEEMAAKLALMEKRLAQLESRLSDNEQKTKEVKVLATNTGASNRGILGGGATAKYSATARGVTFAGLRKISGKRSSREQHLSKFMMPLANHQERSSHCVHRWIWCISTRPASVTNMASTARFPSAKTR